MCPDCCNRINHFGTMSNGPDDRAAEAINATDPFELPIDMRFNEGHLVSIVTYSVLMVVSIVGNVTVLVLILKKRSSNRSRINTMLIHLAIADLMVIKKLTSSPWLSYYHYMTLLNFYSDFIPSIKKQ